MENGFPHLSEDMQKQIEFVLLLLKKLMNPEMSAECAEEYAADIDFDILYEELCAQNIAAMVYKPIAEFSSVLAIPGPLLDKWKERSFNIGVRTLLRLKDMNTVLSMGKEENIRMAVVKGQILSILYPDPLMRYSGDVDILFMPEDEERLKTKLREMQYTVEEDEDNVFTAVGSSTIKYEFHRRLWPETEGERLELLESLKLTEPSDFVEVQLTNCKAETLGYTEHLVYLIAHAVKHFSVAGIGLRHLLDLSLYVNAYYDRIDWARFWDCIDKLNYRKITRVMFSACIQYISMTDKALEPENRTDDVDWIIEDSFEAGVFGNKTKERWKTTDVIKPYYLNPKKRIPKTRFGMVMKFMFPDKEGVKDRDISNDGALPVGWVKRWVSMTKRWKSDDKRVGVFKRAGIAKKRIKMLQDMGIIKNK